MFVNKDAPKRNHYIGIHLCALKTPAVGRTGWGILSHDQSEAWWNLEFPDAT